MTVRFPADADTFCPKCLASNHGTAITVWQVADAAGTHYECDCCARMWRGQNPSRVNSKGQPVAAEK